jgi:RNA polymerase sigma-70 factor (ECF subfamily)
MNFKENKNTDNYEKFEKLFSESKGKLFTVAYAVVQNRDSAEDVLQDAYIKAWKKFGDYDSSKKFVNWMTTIVRNTAIDMHRNNSRQVMAYSLDWAPNGSQAVGLNTEDKSIDLVGGYEKQEFFSLLMKEINSLPKELNTVMSLFCQGYSYDEIAGKTKITLSAVRARVHRAKKILKKNTKLATFANF